MKELDMTKGKALPILIRFAIPLMLGDLFQQLYGAADSIVVGRYAGDFALAAVASSNFLIRLILGLFTGISAGASVIIAQCKGAGQKDKQKAVIHTMAGLTLLGGILLTVLSMSVTRPLLEMVSTPAKVMEKSTIYLRTYFAGTLFSLVYNVGSGILYSFGDSKHPFYFLSCSSVVNIVLDLLFIRIFHLGVFGAALATILAQLLSACLIVNLLLRTKQEYRINRNEIRIQKDLVPEILQMGLPAGIQNCVVALSNVIVQANINRAGANVMAGFGIFNKVDGIIMLPVSGIALALTTYTAQNYGAKKTERLKDGAKAMLLLQVGAWVVGCIICYFFGKPIFSLFTKDALDVKYAVMTMKYIMAFYWVFGVGYSLTCMLRGVGKSKEASILYICSMCFARQIYIVVLKQCHVGIGAILSSYPFSWAMSIVFCAMYVVYLKKNGKLIELKGI